MVISSILHILSSNLALSKTLSFSAVHDWYRIRTLFVELFVNAVEVLNYLKLLRMPA
jgi:hypothetical protein